MCITVFYFAMPLCITDWGNEIYAINLLYIAGTKELWHMCTHFFLAFAVLVLITLSICVASGQGYQET
jgi:hypothetical protein